MADETKGLFQSKTFWGVVVIVVASMSRRWFNIDLDEQTQTDIATELGVIAGSVLAIWGRVSAAKRIDGIK